MKSDMHYKSANNCDKIAISFFMYLIYAVGRH